MLRSVWDQIYYGMDTICLHMTGSNLNSMVPYGITFISGPIWCQRADLIHTGPSRSHVNIRLTSTNFILAPKGSSPCKCLVFRDIGYIKFQAFLIAFLGIFCQQVDILCFSVLSLFHYMWSFKASFTVLL